MAEENILDNVRTQQAGLPAPKSYAALKRMFRSVLEEMNEQNGVTEESRQLLSKLDGLRNYLEDLYIPSKGGWLNLFDDFTGTDIEDKVKSGEYKSRLPADWIYKDDGNLPPLEAVNKLNIIARLVQLMMVSNSWYLNPGHKNREDLRIEAKNHYSNEFFDYMNKIDEIVKGLPKGLSNDVDFIKKSSLDNFIDEKNRLPLKAQIELDPLLYTEHPIQIIQDYAKGFI